jgi:hypothetical protein
VPEISREQKLYLRGRAAHSKTWQEREAEMEQKAEQMRIKQELEAFSELLHAWHLTADGQKAADIVVW